MIREKSKRRTLKEESTEAKYRGGMARSSEEVSVMEMERRGSCYPVLNFSQPIILGGAKWTKQSRLRFQNKWYGKHTKE
jgi:hypothetical protein